jgi:4-hydroxy-3-methylbut-2-enyl diphosphate reductase
MKPSLNVLQASPRGFCAGVVRAIETLERALQEYGSPIYARHAIVHNPTVIASFERRGVVFVEELEDVPEGAVVVFSAHGVPRHITAEAARRDLSAIDATCPLVSKVHSEVRHHVAAGRDVLLIGHPDHPEVLGTTGQVPKGRVHVVPDRATAQALKLDPARHYGLAMQTTLSVSDASHIESALRERFPNMIGPARDDICYATTNRQQAVSQLAPACDAFIILGGKASSNSRRLVETAASAGCSRVQLVEDPGALPLSWLEGVRVLGVGSGASTPEASMDALLDRLSDAFEVTVAPRPPTDEGVRFGLPVLPPRGGETRRAEPRTRVRRRA